MTGPWEDYQQQPTADPNGPWNDYAAQSSALPKLTSTAKPYDSDQGPDKELPVFLRRDNAFNRLGNLLESGATFGLNTEVRPVSNFLTTLAKTGSLGDASSAYHTAKQEELGKRDVARQEYGILPEIAAGFGSAIPVQGAPVANSLVGQFRQGLPLATGLGAAAGLTSSDGSVGERVRNALLGGTLGVAGQGVGTALGYGLGKLSGYAGRAIADANNPEQAAYRNIAEGVQDAGVNTGDIRDVIAPDAKRATTDQQVSEIVRRSQSGQSQKQIAKEMGLSQGVVADRLQQFADNTRTPLNVIDAVKLIKRQQGEQGGDTALTGLATTAAGLDKAAAGIAAGRLVQRQVEQPGRIADHLEQLTSGPSFDDTLGAISDALGQKSREAYGQAFENALPFDLAPIIRQYRGIEHESAGELKSGLSNAIDLFYKPGMVEAGEAGAQSAALSNAADAASNLGSQTAQRAIAPDNAQSIIGFLRSKGGVKPSGETKAINAERIPGLINKNGMTPDKAREALIEAGFMREDPFAEPTTSVSDFHDLLGRAVAGEKIVREGDQGLFQAGQDYAAQRAQSAAMEQAARDHLSEIGMDPAIYDKMSAAERQRIAERVAQAPEDRRLQEAARLHFPNGEMDTLSAPDRIELAKRIDAGEDPHNVFEELAIRHENNRSLADTIDVPAGMMPGSKPQEEGATRFTKFAEPIADLQRFQNARQALDQQIARSMQDGRPTPLTRRLTQFRQAITAEVEKANPDFASANAQFSGAKDAQKIIETAQKATLRAGGKQRADLDYFNSLTPEQKALYRVAYKQKLTDDALNTTRGGSTSTRAYTSESAQNFIRQIFEKKEAERLLSDINKENVTSETLKDVLMGSRTAPLAKSMEDLAENAHMVGDLVTANVPGFMRRVGRRVASGISANQARKILDITTNTDRGKILNFLDNIDAASRYNALANTRVQGRSNYLAPRFGAAARNALVDYQMR